MTAIISEPKHIKSTETVSDSAASVPVGEDGRTASRRSGRMRKPTAKIAAVFRSCAVWLRLREEGGGEIEREGGVGVEVVPLDEIAGRADDDRLEAARGVGEVRRWRACGAGARAVIHVRPDPRFCSRSAQARFSIDFSSSSRARVCMSMASLMEAICFSRIGCQLASELLARGRAHRRAAPRGCARARGRAPDGVELHQEVAREVRHLQLGHGRRVHGLRTSVSGCVERRGHEVAAQGRGYAHEPLLHALRAHRAALRSRAPWRSAGSIAGSAEAARARRSR